MKPLILVVLPIIIIFNSCSFKHGTSTFYNEIRTSKLKKPENTILRLSPNLELPEKISEYTENLGFNKGYYWTKLETKLNRYNIFKQDEARFILEIKDVKFNEIIQTECISDSITQYQEECFDLNELGIIVNVQFLDKELNKSMEKTFTATEKTRVKREAFGDGYKESSLNTPYTFMMERVIGKISAKYCSFIKKQLKAKK